MKKYILLLLVLLISISIGCISKTTLVIDNEKYVLVTGGTFQMGSTSGGSFERPVHSVTVSSFYMSKYEVTQKEYKDVIGISVRQQRDKLDADWPMSGERNNYPMYYVSWNEAVEYCNALSLKEGLTSCYSGSGGSVSCNINANGYWLPVAY